MKKIKNLIINTSKKRNKYHALTKLLVNVTLLGPKPKIKCKHNTKDNWLMYKQTSGNLVEILGLNKLLKSFMDIQMLRCNYLTNTFKQSILQVLSLSQYVFVFLRSSAYIRLGFDCIGMASKWI